MSSGKPRVAIVMPVGVRRGGAEAMLYDLLAARDSGCDWRVILLQPGPMAAEIRALGVPAVLVSAGRLREPAHYVRAVRKIAAITRRDRCSIVLSWMTKGHLYGSPAARLSGATALFHQAGTSSRHDSIDRIAAALPGAGVITLSHASARAQADIWPNRPVRMVYPGVDLDKFDPGRLPPTEQARTALGLVRDGPLVGMVARLQHWKGVHIFIEAMAQVSTQIPGVRAVIVGGVDPQEPAYAEHLKQLLQSRRLTSVVSLVGAQRDIPLWMQAMDVVVHASDAEPFGIVVLEAMALAKAVIAGSEGGPAEIIESPAQGRLVAFEDAVGISTAIQELLADRDVRRAMGIAARRRVQSFSSHAFAEKFVAAMLDLVSRQRYAIRANGDVRARAP